MTPALLLVALFSVAPAVQPPITVGVTDTNCGEITIEVRAPQGTKADGYGDLANQPPWQHTDRPMTIVLHRQPGTRIEWGVGHFGTPGAIVSGVHAVPPCISAPEPIVPTLLPPITITRTRSDLWDWVLRRFGGAR